MVVCIVALVVFGILGIFSARYRRLANEAFGCVFKMVQLKPCDTGFDQRIKSGVTSKLMKVPAAARFVYKNFTIISWIFTISFFASLGYSAYGIYNLVVFGSCTPESPGTGVINQAAHPAERALQQLYSTLSCNEALIVYAIIIIFAIAILAVRYLKGRNSRSKWQK